MLVDNAQPEKKSDSKEETSDRTFSYTKYEDSANKITYFDTVGLGKTSSGVIAADKAMKELKLLIEALEKRINCVIFVTKMGRITDFFESNCNLFYKNICGEAVPLILVITHCEAETNPEEWWEKEKTAFTAYLKCENVVLGCASNGDGMHPVFKKIALNCYNETKQKLTNEINSVRESSKSIQLNSTLSPWKVMIWKFVGKLATAFRLERRGEEWISKHLGSLSKDNTEKDGGNDEVFGLMNYSCF